MTETTWEGMHSGTAQEDKAYVKGIEKGRFLESGYIVTLLQAELTRIKKLRSDYEECSNIYGLEKAIDILDRRCEEVGKRNGWH